MEHQARVEAHIAELQKRGVGKYTTAPPLFRLLWLLGLEVPPPLFLPFLANMAIACLGFGLLLSALNPSGWMHYDDPSIWISVNRIVSGSLLFGAVMAAYYRWKSRTLELPDWRSYTSAR